MDPVKPSGCDLERLGGQDRAEDRGCRCGVGLMPVAALEICGNHLHYGFLHCSQASCLSSNLKKIWLDVLQTEKHYRGHPSLSIVMNNSNGTLFFWDRQEVASIYAQLPTLVREESLSAMVTNSKNLGGLKLLPSRQWEVITRTAKGGIVCFMAEMSEISSNQDARFSQ